MDFKLHAPYSPTGDQPEAIRALTRGIQEGMPAQVLLGVTGSGKTFTMASVIEKLNRPTLVLAHNKTLAAQLCSEFREFFPENAVEYFISYYDYYQPEAYIAHTDTYIEKDSAINDEIERLRHSATSSLFERRDVIVVSSVSCIYGLGDPIDYQNMVISLRTGMEKSREELMAKLVDIRYERNDIDFSRNHFRVRGDTVEIYPAYWTGRAIRVEFFGDEIDRISEINAVTGLPERVISHVAIYPASHYVASREKLNRAILEIEKEMEEREKWFKENDKLLEAQRIRQRTMYDIEMLQEIGFCSGIENYSRVISGRAPGTPPMTLLDYFPKDFLLFVDESHVTLPQVRAMYAGDRSRKESLVDYGFRLPSAFDNRPLTFDEFQSKIHQAVYVSATPAEYERERAGQIVQQVIRPTGLLDPKVEVRPVEDQIDDLIGECNRVIERKERVLVTTLTKKMAEDLTNYLQQAGIRVRYAGDRSRKESLVDYGFRLPSAFDNRPLTFDEFQSKIHQAVYVSATPAEYERERAGQIVQQVIRPTGLLDPKVEVRPVEDQIDDLIGECNRVIERKERVLVTTLTKKMAEDLTNYLQQAGIRVRYMHSDVAALERMEILRDLRMAKFDVLVGINLLREGLDLPEVSLVAILDADKEGFLRSETSLIQTIGRAARNAEGRVIMYADKITPAMRAAIDETERRRAIQDAYNKAHGIVPKTIIKDVRELIEITQAEGEAAKKNGVKMTKAEREREIAKLEKEMRAAARMMEYEYAAVLRDRIIELRGERK